MNDNKGGNWTGGDTDWLKHAREDFENAKKILDAYGLSDVGFPITPEAWKILHESSPKDYGAEWGRRPGDSLWTRFKKWRKRRKMIRMFKRGKIMDGGLFGRYNKC